VQVQTNEVIKYGNACYYKTRKLVLSSVLCITRNVCLCIKRTGLCLSFLMYVKCVFFFLLLRESVVKATSRKVRRETSAPE
jgi:hypothetical protein